MFLKQFGVVSRAQVLAAGGTARMIHNRIDAQVWETVHAGVYRLAGTPASWLQRLMAACLACGSEACVSHHAAAGLWQLRGFGEGPVEVSIWRSARRRRDLKIHRVLLDSVDLTSVGTIPVTTPARTLIDVAGVVPRDVVEEALDDALRRRLVTRSRLRWRINELAAKGRRGIKVIRELLDARETGVSVPQSVFETRLLRVLRDARLPTPSLQHEVRDRGRLVAIVDFAFPEARVAIEADGYRWHSGRVRWERDLARRNRLTALGWRVVHVTWSDLRREPRTIVAAISVALDAAQP